MEGREKASGRILERVVYGTVLVRNGYYWLWYGKSDE